MGSSRKLVRNSPEGKSENHLILLNFYQLTRHDSRLRKVVSFLCFSSRNRTSGPENLKRAPQQEKKKSLKQDSRKNVKIKRSVNNRTTTQRKMWQGSIPPPRNHKTSVLLRPAGNRKREGASPPHHKRGNRRLRRKEDEEEEEKMHSIAGKNDKAGHKNLSLRRKALPTARIISWKNSTKKNRIWEEERNHGGRTKRGEGWRCVIAP